VTDDDKSSKDQSESPATNKSSVPDNRSKRVYNDEMIKVMIQMRQDTEENIIDGALNQLVQNGVCLSLSDIRLIDQTILDNIIFKKVIVGLEEESEP
jgi:hypothetical protein